MQSTKTVASGASNVVASSPDCVDVPEAATGASRRATERSNSGGEIMGFCCEDNVLQVPPLQLERAQGGGVTRAQGSHLISLM